MIHAIRITFLFTALRGGWRRLLLLLLLVRRLRRLRDGARFLCRTDTRAAAYAGTSSAHSACAAAAARSGYEHPAVR